MKIATYTQLKDGSWGIRVAGSAGTDETVLARKKSGESREVQVGRVLWIGPDKRNGETISLCTIAPKGKVWDGDAFNGYGAKKGRWRRACPTGGNCSSVGQGRSCGAPDCDGWE